MTVTFPHGFPWIGSGPIPDIQPFTYSDAYTYADILAYLKRYLEALREYVNKFPDTVNEAIQEMVSEVEDRLTAQNEWVESEIVDLTQYVNDSVQSIINNSIEVQDPVVAQLLESVSLSSSALSRVIQISDEARMRIRNVTDYGAIGDGVTDDSQAISDAVAAANNGDEIFFPALNYRISTSITNNKKSLKFNAIGAHFVKDGNFTSVTLSGDFDSVFDAHNVGYTTINEGTRDFPVVTLSTVGVPDWKRGDIVKVISGDIIPGTKDEGNGSELQGRVGQFFSVHSVNGTDVTLMGEANDPFTVKVRIARIQPINVEWSGGSFDVSDSHINAGYVARTFNLFNLAYPLIQDVVIERTTSMGFAFLGCYVPKGKNLAVRWAYNNLEASGLGYGVANMQSQGLILDNLYVQNARSGYTDGHAFVSDETPNFAYYGRPSNARITNSVAENVGTGFGTHSSGVNTLISNCIVRTCGHGIAFRGRNNVAVDNVVIDSFDSAVKLFTERNSRSYGHVIDGLNVYGAYHLIEGDFNTYSQSPTFGQRETIACHVRNVFGSRVKGLAVRAVNAKLDLKDVFASVIREATRSIIYADNSGVSGESVKFNTDLVNTTGSLAVIQCTGTGSIIDIKGLDIKGSLAGFTKLVHASAVNTVRVSDANMGGLPSSITVDTLNDESWVDWKVSESNSLSSAYLAMNTAAITNVQTLSKIGNVRNSEIFVNVVATDGTDFAKLPNPSFRGQKLTILNTGTGSVTIKDGSTYGTHLNGSDAVIPSGKSVSLAGLLDSWYLIDSI